MDGVPLIFLRADYFVDLLAEMVEIIIRGVERGMS